MECRPRDAVERRYPPRPLDQRLERFRSVAVTEVTAGRGFCPQCGVPLCSN
jgi:hypothetical protein